MKAYKILAILAASALLIGCNSQKKLAKGETTTPDAPKTEVIVKKSVQQRAVEAQPDFLSAYAPKANFKITYQNKQISSSGTITMIKDSICIISVQPILNIELARIELTHQDVIFVDKMNKRYVQMTYAEVQQQTGLPVTFDDVQNLLMGRMTVIGKPQNILWGANAKTVSNGGKTQLLLTDGKLSYDFLIDENDLSLRRSIFTTKSEKATITYDGFALRNGVQFPSSIGVEYTGGGYEAACTLSLPNISIETTEQTAANQLKVNTSRINLRNYKKTTLSTILQ